MKTIKFNNFLSLILALYLFFVPNDFLTGRYLNGVGFSTLLSGVILIWAVIQVIVTGKIYIPTDVKVLCLLVIVGIIPIIFYQIYPIDRIITFIYYICLTISIVNLLYWNKSKINADLIIYFAFCGVLTMCLYLLLKGTLGYGKLRLTTVERDLNPNVASGFVLMGLGAMISIYNRKKFLLIYLCLISILIITLLLLQSKTALISLILTLTIIVLMYLRNKIKERLFIINIKATIRTISIIGLLSIFVILLLRQAMEYFGINLIKVNRIYTLFSNDLEVVTTERSSIWSNALKDANFLIGKGIFTFRELYGRAPHSLYISTIVETGILGLILVGKYFSYYYQKSKEVKKLSYRSYIQQIFIISNLFIFGFGNDVMEYKFFWMGIFLWYVILYDLLNRTKSVNINAKKSIHY